MVSNPDMKRFETNCQSLGNSHRLRTVLLPLLARVLVVSALSFSLRAAEKSITAPDAKLEKLAGDFEFTEGPACDLQGNVLLRTSRMIGF